MKINLTDYVNVFYGNGEVDLPQSKGIAKAWHPIKALCGNTHPHAAFVFGQLTCGTYSGGYSSGYGNHMPNYSTPPEKFLEENMFRGFSHYHCSGTGAMGLYYNYAVTTPITGGLETGFTLRSIKEESGSPGYYKVVLEDDIVCEATVDEHCAYHKYSTSTVAIDFSNDGLDKSFGEGFFSCSDISHIEVLSNNEVCASVVMQGLALYFYAKSEHATSCKLWKNYEVCERVLDLNRVTDRFGAMFETDKDSIDLKISFSLLSFEHAKSLCDPKRDFESCVNYTKKAWNEALGKFEVEASEEEKVLFYSNLYHTLIKPSDFTGHSPLFDAKMPYVLGFETLWDQYKTQLPLIFSVYPEISYKIVRSYLSIGKSLGMLPHTLALSSNYSLEAIQASALPQHFLADAYYRAVRIDDMDEFFEIIYMDMQRLKEKLFDKPTHLLDFTEAAKSMQAIALLEKNAEYAEKFRELILPIAGVFDEETGLLKSEYQYYEGNHWNYSFRLMNDMEERITLAGGKEKFESLLDTFFGYENSEDVSGRFEGFNNETDMETPYSYHYINRHDKLAEIISLADECMFVDGVGGLPGNNDTGGLSSLFICNNMGLFPVAGQDLMIVGMPRYKSITLKLANGNTLRIKKIGTGIVPTGLEVNGVALPELAMRVVDFMQGGEIKIFCDDSTDIKI